MQGLHTTIHQGGQVQELSPGAWRLSLPPGGDAQYCLAQLDDYRTPHGFHLQWRPPVRLALEARVSSAGLPGTWGFGFWNEPLGVSLFTRPLRVPALPQAVWFFQASAENFLALRDDHVANGFMAAVFSSLRLPALLLLPGLPFVPLLAWPLAARRLRQAARLLVRDEAARVETDPCAWHAYAVEWLPDEVRLELDGETCFHSRCSPAGRLGAVIWIDNQYAAFPPSGRIRMGSLAMGAEHWMEVRHIR
ncbi:MAG: hypothetical protein GYA17_15810, partial [Chloroflexi bacterium]|nr:hypothetical protein [Chloroflexota bacterium]